ncbi:MAG: uroporphyrinogen-III C-methyltransferase [Candidatus Marinimicrobia bacterium]|nr:uroporphyrinogen-III C-methyltransferase [Candidatus Neomarinimicrobiota bacterium]
MNTLLPVFLKLENEPTLVVGGGKIAHQKIEQLLKSKASITVKSPEISENIRSLPVKITGMAYQKNDVEGYKLVIAATDDEKINCQVYEDCQQFGIPVNVVDQPELCTFYMGSVFQDGDLKVAISTNGKCPSFGKYIRDHISNISRGMWGKALEKIALQREKIINFISSYSQKQQIMEKLVNKTNKEFFKKEVKQGKVFIVGAGPGDPELITVKGLQVIQNANVILHDALVHPHLVFDINPGADKIFVGKREGKHSVSQATIQSLLIQAANQGKQVVRLKGGDPFIFGRGAEEAEALAAAGIPFEVIAGVTAGIGAAAGFGIPLTSRNEAQSTTLLTGHQCEKNGNHNWKALVDLNSTLVFYMGVKNITEIVTGLTNNGKSGSTPLAIVQNGTMVTQEIFISTLENVEKELEGITLKTPAIIIIGDVVNHHKRLQKYVNSIPADYVDPVGDFGFDIWKNEVVVA